MSRFYFKDHLTAYKMTDYLIDEYSNNAKDMTYDNIFRILFN